MQNCNNIILLYVLFDFDGIMELYLRKKILSPFLRIFAFLTLFCAYQYIIGPLSYTGLTSYYILHLWMMQISIELESQLEIQMVWKGIAFHKSLETLRRLYEYFQSCKYRRCILYPNNNKWMSVCLVTPLISETSKPILMKLCMWVEYVLKVV